MPKDTIGGKRSRAKAGAGTQTGETYEEYVQRTLNNPEYIRQNRPNEYLRRMIELSNAKEINGRPVVNEIPSGFKYWPIGKNAPEGYIGLIRGSGSTADIRYFKSKYADEIANMGAVGHSAMNYDTLKTLDKVIRTRENTIERYTAQGKPTARLKKELTAMKRAREIRKELGL